MRKILLLFLIAGLNAWRPAQAASVITRGAISARAYGFAANGTCSDTSANAWRAAVIANGGSISAARYKIICTMIAGLKSDGTWSSLDRLWILAGENAPQALTDLVANELAVGQASPTFSASLGYRAASTSSYISSSFNFSTAAHWAQNSAHLMVYVNNSTGSGSPAIGDVSLNADNIYPNYSGSAYARLNNGTQPGYAVTNALGMTLGSRTASNSSTTYRNGASIGSNTNASSAPGNSTLALLAAFNAVSVYGDVNDRIAAASIGGGLSSAQAASLYNRVLTALTAIGAN